VGVTGSSPVEGFFFLIIGVLEMGKKNKGAVELISLICTETGLRNYTTKKDRRNTPEKLELMKYCPKLRKHTLHREGKIK
jgi:large subunit ribosomal protein L33